MRLYPAALILVWLAVAGATLSRGFGYYATSLAERAYADEHDRLKPSGPIGHGYGVAGTTLIVVGVTLYSVRKRASFLHRWGKLKHWLELHIFLCTLGPFLVLLHTTFKFGGIVAIAFWSMTLVVLSGMFGRYVYARIPKTMNGQFLSLQAVRHRREAVAAMVTEVLGPRATALREVIAPAPLAGPGTAGALALSLRSDLAGRSERKRVEQLLRRHGVPAAVRERAMDLVAEQVRLERQIALLDPFRRLFGYWHVFHLPLALVMLAIVVVHVLVAVVLGYTWPR